MRTILTSILVLAVAETMAQTTYLTFDDALALSFECNPSLSASEYAERAAHRERQAAIGLFMPRLSLRGAYTHFNNDIKVDLNHIKGQATGLLAPLLPSMESLLSPLLSLDLSYTLQRRNSAFLGGDIVWPIFTGGKILTANKAAKINEERATNRTREVRSALVVEMVERYFGVELASRAVSIRKEAVAVVEQHLRDVVLLEREGMAIESERLYAEYRLAEAERELRRAELQLSTAQRALQTTLGVESDVLPSTPMFMLSSVEPLDYFQTMATLHNAQIAEVAHLRELSRMNVRLQRAELMPEVVAMGGAIFCGHQLSPLLPRMAVGVGLNFPIFDGLRSEFRYSAARQQLRRVETLEDKAEQDIRLLVESLYNSLQASLSSIPSVERSVRFAEDFLRAKRAAFREGVATSTDVVDAALNLSRAQLERLQTAYEFDLALARLLDASGVGETFVQYSNSATAQSVF